MKLVSRYDLEYNTDNVYSLSQIQYHSGSTVCVFKVPVVKLYFRVTLQVSGLFSNLMSHQDIILCDT